MSLLHYSITLELAYVTGEAMGFTCLLASIKNDK